MPGVCLLRLFSQSTVCMSSGKPIPTTQEEEPPSPTPTSLHHHPSHIQPPPATYCRSAPDTSSTADGNHADELLIPIVPRMCLYKCRRKKKWAISATGGVPFPWPCDKTAEKWGQLRAWTLRTQLTRTINGTCDDNWTLLEEVWGCFHSWHSCFVPCPGFHKSNIVPCPGIVARVNSPVQCWVGLQTTNTQDEGTSHLFTLTSVECVSVVVNLLCQHPPPVRLSNFSIYCVQLYFGLNISWSSNTAAHFRLGGLWPGSYTPGSGGFRTSSIRCPRTQELNQRPPSQAESGTDGELDTSMAHFCSRTSNELDFARIVPRVWAPSVKTEPLIMIDA